MVKALLPYVCVLVLCITATALITARIVQWREEKRLGEFQNLILKKQRDEVQNIYQTMRGWRHDYHNHMQTIKIYLQQQQIEETLDYLEHLEEDLDIDTLAEGFFISKYHMMRLFRRETGMTVHNYLTQRRLLRARDLITDGMRATEACYRSGFRSYSSFTRAYGQHFGTTPTGRMDITREREESYE